MRSSRTGLLLLLVLQGCTPEVETGQPEIQAAASGDPAGLEGDTVESLVKSKIPELEACYQALKSRNPQAQGKVLIAFTVLPDGRCRDARILASTLADPFMEGCIVSTVERWTFPRPRDGQPVQVRYPFAFGP